jgi:hypothetical protein
MINRSESTVLLDGVNHIAWLSKDAAGWAGSMPRSSTPRSDQPRDHGQDGNETMTIIRIGPHTS